jgi:hypothetical protein
MQEVVLDLNRELRSHLAAPSVVHFYAWLLAGVPAGINSGALNHALCSFLWRVVLPQHLDMEPLLYQVCVGVAVCVAVCVSRRGLQSQCLRVRVV